MKTSLTSESRAYSDTTVMKTIPESKKTGMSGASKINILSIAPFNTTNAIREASINSPTAKLDRKSPAKTSNTVQVGY